MKLSENEKKIFDLWKKVSPASAYTEGIEECAGLLFIPTEENMHRAVESVRLIRPANDSEQTFLASLETSLQFTEPYMIPETIAGTLYRYLVKNAPRHAIENILKEARRMLTAVDYLFKKHWTPEIDTMTINNCNSLLEILSVIKTQGFDVADVEAKTKAFQKKFTGVSGGFETVLPFLEKNGEGFGREDTYTDILEKVYCYPERADEIEERALGWLVKELPTFHSLSMQLAEKFDCEPTVASVLQALEKKYAIDAGNVITFITALRQKVQTVVENHLVDIDAAYNVRILETPTYLRTFIPSAAMTTFDTFTTKPTALFYITTAQIHGIDALQALIHEEYGHCVNYINSAVRAENFVEKIPSALSIPVTEGISFNREKEFLSLCKELTNSTPRGTDKDMLDYFDKIMGKDWLVAFEFEVMQWRIVRFLRAIYDVRVNIGMQSVPEFVMWAHTQTGLGKKLIYDQTFGLHTFAGYLPAYSITGMMLEELQHKVREKAKSIREFNTYACSMGFPSRRIFDRRLDEWIKG